MNSGELRHSEPQNICAVTTEHLCSVRRTSVLRSQNIRALSTHQCIICCLPTKRLTCKVANRSCVEDHWFPKSLIIVAERKCPSDFQGASHSNSQHLSADSSRQFHRLFVRCPQTLREMPADASRITALCLTRIHGLPIRQFRGKQ